MARPERVYGGKVAILTGAASGIGAALANELARCGADVVLADRQVDLAERVATGIRETGGRATAVEVDVRDLASVTRVVDDTRRQLGAVDFFFNNAGIAVGGEMSSTYAPRDWDDVFDVNVRGVANGIQAVYPVMIRQRRGHIVNTASVAGLIASARAGEPATAAKHAVVGLSKALPPRGQASRRPRIGALPPGSSAPPSSMAGKYGRANVVGVSEERLSAMWEELRPIEAATCSRATPSGRSRATKPSSSFRAGGGPCGSSTGSPRRSVHGRGNSSSSARAGNLPRPASAQADGPRAWPEP